MCLSWQDAASDTSPAQPPSEHMAVVNFQLHPAAPAAVANRNREVRQERKRLKVEEMEEHESQVAVLESASARPDSLSTLANTLVQQRAMRFVSPKAMSCHRSVSFVCWVSFQPVEMFIKPGVWKCLPPHSRSCRISCFFGVPNEPHQVLKKFIKTQGLASLFETWWGPFGTPEKQEICHRVSHARVFVRFSLVFSGIVGKTRTLQLS